MAKQATGYLTSTGTFYETEDEADYHDYIYNLEQHFQGFAHAFEVPEDSRDKLAAFLFAFIKANAAEVIALLQCHERLNTSDDAAGQVDGGGEGVREPVRNGDAATLEGSANAENTPERVEEEAGEAVKKKHRGSRSNEGGSEEE